MIKRILVGLGGTPFAATAIRRAVELARTHGAELTAVTVVNVSKLRDVGPYSTGSGGDADFASKERIHITEKSAEEAISRFTRACKEATIPYQVKRETGDAFTKLIAASRYHDLTVVGLRGLFDFGVIPEVQQGLFELFSRGVHPILACAREYRPVRTALIAYNGTTNSAGAMRRFVEYKLWPEMKLKIACFDHPKSEAEAWLEDARRYCESHGFMVETANVPKPPRKSILPRAEQWGADLIVLSTSPRNFLVRKVFGDTTMHLLANSEKPLFLSF